MFCLPFEHVVGRMIGFMGFVLATLYKTCLFKKQRDGVQRHTVKIEYSKIQPNLLNGYSDK